MSLISKSILFLAQSGKPTFVTSNYIHVLDSCNFARLGKLTRACFLGGTLENNTVITYTKRPSTQKRGNAFQLDVKVKLQTLHVHETER